ncbi:MAG: transglycosylase SLT domain-containing protein, partial [Candidatus Kryptoniota bacterium]
MIRPHVRGLAIRFIIFILIGAAIILTQKSNAARYSYDSTVVPEASIPKLDRQTYVFLTEYGKQLQQYCDTYGVDWRLALAILRQESAFDPEATSDKGATGLMQLMPQTGLQLATLNNIDSDAISDPVENIRLGVIHLRDMLRQFSNSDGDNRIELAAAAYNCGLARIQDAQTVAEFLGDEPQTWTSVRSCLPLLSARYEPLQKHIWAAGMPAAGTFGG